MYSIALVVLILRIGAMQGDSPLAVPVADSVPFRGTSLGPVAVSADGGLVARGEIFGGPLVYKRIGKKARVLARHVKVSDLCFSDDGRYLAGTGIDDVLKVWDLKSRREVLRKPTSLNMAPRIHGTEAPNAEESGRVTIYSLISGSARIMYQYRGLDIDSIEQCWPESLVGKASGHGRQGIAVLNPEMRQAGWLVSSRQQYVGWIARGLGVWAITISDENQGVLQPSEIQLLDLRTFGLTKVGWTDIASDRGLVVIGRNYLLYCRTHDPSGELELVLEEFDSGRKQVLMTSANQIYASCDGNGKLIAATCGHGVRLWALAGEKSKRR